MLNLTADTITDDQIEVLVRHKMKADPANRVHWLGMGDEAMADPRVGAPYKSYCRRICAEAWNEIYDFDLDAAKELWLGRLIDATTWDDALIDVTTRNPVHVARRWAALARCLEITSDKQGR